jgi:hypothetical protein
MVRACYRALFRRERENERAARQKTRLTNLEALLTDFMSSPENQTIIPGPIIPGPQKDDSFLDSQIRTSQIQALANEEVRHGKSNCAAG